LQLERGAQTAIGSSTGSRQVPVALSGLAIPLMTSSPSSSTVPSASRSMFDDVKTISGWLVASKKSGPLTTCSRNSGGLRIEIEFTCARPSRRTPSRSDVSRAATSANVVRKEPTPMWRAPAWKLEWSGSAV